MARIFFGGPIKLVFVVSAALLAAIASPGGAQTAARVQVVFAGPEKFTDVKDDYLGSDRNRDILLDQLKLHLQHRGVDHVPEGHQLRITITDVDMAGEFEPGRNPGLGGARIVRAVYPPRIALRFELTDSTGKAIGTGQRTLTDLAFLSKPDIYRNDLLKHEKSLLDDWLDREFLHNRRP